MAVDGVRAAEPAVDSVAACLRERRQKALAASWSPAWTSSGVIAGVKSIEAFTAMKNGSATDGIWDGSLRSKKIRPVRLPSTAVK